MGDTFSPEYQSLTQALRPYLPQLVAYDRYYRQAQARYTALQQMQDTQRLITMLRRLEAERDPYAMGRMLAQRGMLTGMGRLSPYLNRLQIGRFLYPALPVEVAYPFLLTGLAIGVRPSEAVTVNVAGGKMSTYALPYNRMVDTVQPWCGGVSVGLADWLQGGVWLVQAGEGWGVLPWYALIVPVAGLHSRVSGGIAGYWHRQYRYRSETWSESFPSGAPYTDIRYEERKDWAVWTRWETNWKQWTFSLSGRYIGDRFLHVLPFVRVPGLEEVLGKLGYTLALGRVWIPVGVEGGYFRQRPSLLADAADARRWWQRGAWLGVQAGWFTWLGQVREFLPVPTQSAEAPSEVGGGRTIQTIQTLTIQVEGLQAYGLYLWQAQEGQYRLWNGQLGVRKRVFSSWWLGFSGGVFTLLPVDEQLPMRRLYQAQVDATWTKGEWQVQPAFRYYQENTGYARLDGGTALTWGNPHWQFTTGMYTGPERKDQKWQWAWNGFVQLGYRW